jgi:hypothetical protein
MSKRRLTGEAAVFAADLLWSDLVPDAAAREAKRQAIAMPGDGRRARQPRSGSI